jgi:hypothetical protein
VKVKIRALTKAKPHYGKKEEKSQDEGKGQEKSEASFQSLAFSHRVSQGIKEENLPEERIVVKAQSREEK